MASYYSDRERGPVPRTAEAFSLAAWGGVVSAITTRVTNGSFGGAFPEECPDGRGVCGTALHAMGLAVLAEIPALAEAAPTGAYVGGNFSGWPPAAQMLPSTLAILDLIEFCTQRVAEPRELDHHSYFGHDHLAFDADAGVRRWRDDINRLFARQGLAYELAPDGHVARLGTPVVTDAIRRVALVTGDQPLDELLERARDKYLSADPAHRMESLEQLWDALERAKTLRSPDKQTGARLLIAEVESSRQFGERLETELRELTAIGNNFRIRHHETTKTPLDTGDIDYLFHRCFALLAHLLQLNPS
ncbi:MAG TPA: hypothetical protein VGS21_12105 [Acidimicrobiales bacterium]|nr:hypothetical protein [Acidimicrobiales bacterium]